MDDNDHAVTAFTMLGHGTFHSYELVIPVFVAIWLDVFATNSAVLGVIVGSSYALVGLGAIPSGLLADTYSSKRVIVVCLFGMGVAFVLVSLAQNIVVLTLALLLWGGAASLYHPAALALISRATKERGTAFAYHGIAGNVGVATGPLLAAVLLLVFHWRIVALLMVVPTGVALITALRLEFDETAGSEYRANDGEPDSGRSRPNRSPGAKAGSSHSDSSVTGGQPRTRAEFITSSRVLFTGGFLIIFTIGMLYGAYYRGLFTFLPDVLSELPVFSPIDRFGRSFEPSQYVYSGLLLLGAVGQYVGGKTVERVPVEYALVGTYLTLSVIALVFIQALAAPIGFLLAAAGLLGFLAFMAAPINQEAIASYSSPSMRGLSFGYTYTAIFGLGAFGATLAGVVLSWWSPRGLFLILSGIAALTVGFALLLLARGGADRKGSPEVN